jgi:hypothetical protein
MCASSLVPTTATAAAAATTAAATTAAIASAIASAPAATITAATATAAAVDHSVVRVAAGIVKGVSVRLVGRAHMRTTEEEKAAARCKAGRVVCASWRAFTDGKHTS